MSHQTYLTAEGEQKLKNELAELKGPRREDLAQRLRSAIQMGDLSENADYHKAKEDQAFLEGRIQEIEAYNEPNIRARLEPKGELVVVKPGDQVLLETQTLQLLATIVDMDYGSGAMPQKSYFERITLELAIWPRSGQ